MLLLFLLLLFLLVLFFSFLCCFLRFFVRFCTITHVCIQCGRSVFLSHKRSIRGVFYVNVKFSKNLWNHFFFEFHYVFIEFYNEKMHFFNRFQNILCPKIVLNEYSAKIHYSQVSLKICNDFSFCLLLLFFSISPRVNLDFNLNECSSVQLLVQFDNVTLSVRLTIKSDNTNAHICTSKYKRANSIASNKRCQNNITVWYTVFIMKVQR